jgi:hypothetical protein
MSESAASGAFAYLQLHLRVTAGYLGTYPQVMLLASVRSNRHRSAALTVECASKLPEEGDPRYTTREWAVALSDLDAIASDLRALGRAVESEPQAGEADCSWWAQVVLEAVVNDETLRLESLGHGFAGKDAAAVDAVFRRMAGLLDVRNEFVRDVLTCRGGR